MIERDGGAPGGEYALRGEYHRHLDPTWDYYPTYLAKMSWVRRFLDGLPAGTRVLDAGCGEGVLVDEYAGRLDIEGIDPNFEAARVTRGSLTSLPYSDGSFDAALCLDVLEHLPFDDQARALGELRRVLKPAGALLVSVPNLAHLQSRVHFLLRGRLIRTASPDKHPGDRPLPEYLALARAAGFDVRSQHGIFPTVPVLTRLVRRHPASLLWLHRLLTAVLPVPGWSFLVILDLRRPTS